MKKHRFISIVTAAVLITSLAACGGDDEVVTDTRTFDSGKLSVTFDFEKQSGFASNQFAVWIEDMDGNYVNTLFATAYTANGGYKNRPDSIALWVERSGLSSMEKSEVDAVSGATPKTGTLTYSWDLTDSNGEMVPPGEYKFFAEGTLRWKNYVLYSGVIEIGGDSLTVEADAEYHYEADGRNAALTSESSENAMIKSVTASFMPV